tara:strand:+ start:4111 stop:5100 length:990 start_codon:yes stop_codon:yes gene_type:complete
MIEFKIEELEFFSKELKFNTELKLFLNTYFDSFSTKMTPYNKILWFKNLFLLAKHDLSTAHCLQHHSMAHLILNIGLDKKLTRSPKNIDNMIGCYSGYKKLDTVVINDNNTIKGQKYWTSLLDESDYAVFQVLNTKNEKTYIYFYLNEINYKINFDHFDPIGMVTANPGVFIIENDIDISNNILGNAESSDFFLTKNFHNYCFITNFLACSISLLEQLEIYCLENKINAEYLIKKHKLELSSLKLMWLDNLETINIDNLSDEFWHKRNTQYVNGKKMINEIVSTVLTVGSSLFLDKHSKFSQKFRDALMLCSHQGTLFDDIINQNFLKI